MDRQEMRIGLDGAMALKGDGPREQLARKVIGGMADDYPDCRIMVYAPKVPKKRRLSLIDQLHNVEYRLPAPSGFSGRLWQLFGITNCLQPDKIDVYHGLNGELPLNIAAGHVPTVVSVSDTALLDVDKGKEDVREGRVDFLGFGRRFRRYVLKNSLRNATLVVVASQEMKEGIVSLFSIAEENIEVLPEEAFTPEALMTLYLKAITRHQS